jgi:phosphatidylinositol alpha-1,6-mannosyltransferase
MKVAYILPTLQKPSGWWTLCAGLLHHIKPLVEPVIYVPQENASSLQAIRAEFPETTIYSLPTTQQYSLANVRGWRKLLATYQAINISRYPKIDLVHSLEAYPTGLVGHWLARKLGKPHMLTANGTYSVIWALPMGGTLPRSWLPNLDRWAYGRILQATRMVCPISQGTARLMHQYFDNPLSQTVVRPILPGNDYIKLVPQEQALNHSQPPIPTLLSVGDVKSRKGQHISLAAFELLKTQLPQARYWIAGNYSPEGEYYQQLQRFIAEKQLDDVTFLGKISSAELSRCYEQASLFILTPQQDGLHFEGFGLVYLEAGAYGLPVVATRSGGVPDAVKDGETGLLADSGDVEGIADALLRLLTDPELAIRIGRANRLWAEKLTWDSCASQLYNTYQEVLGRSERGSVLPI